MKTQEKETPPVPVFAGGNNNGNSGTERQKNALEVMAENVINSCSIQKMKFFSEKAQEREWVIDGIIPAGQVTLLAGLGGAGKSTLSMQIILNVLLNANIFNNTVTAENARCIYITAEDDSTEIQNRLQSLALHLIENGVATEGEIRDIEASNRLMCIADDNAPQNYINLFTLKNGKNIIETTKHYTTLKKVVEIIKPRLIVLDALTSLFDFDFSGMRDAQHVMRLLKELTSHGSSVLVTHHMTKTAYNPVNFESLLLGVFGSVGMPNKLRHLLILWKNNLFIAKSNLVKRHGWRLTQNELRAFELERLIPEDSFDNVVKNHQKNGNNNSSKETKAYEKHYDPFGIN